MRILVRAFPLRQPESDLTAVTDSLRGEHRDSLARMLRNYGVVHEAWHLQQTPAGPQVLAITVIEDFDEAGPRYASTQTGFDAWFKGQIARLSGISLDETPAGPATTEVFSWTDGAKPFGQMLAT